MIRPLKLNELSIIVEGGMKFIGEAKTPGGFKPDVFIPKLFEMVGNGRGVVLGMFGPTEIQGALGATCHHDLFNDDLVACELFWYVIPEFRGRGVLLLKAFEQWARDRQCKRIQMIHLESLHPGRLKAFYERDGYTHIESGYIKAL